MTKEIVSIIYDTVIKKHFHNTLQLETDGHMWFICQYSQEGKPVRGLGAYEGIYDPLSDKTIDPLEIIEKNRLFEIKDILPSEQHPPSKTITIIKDNQTKIFNIETKKLIPDALNELEQCLLSLIDKIREAPLATLDMEMKFQQSLLNAGDLIDIQFTLVNSGISSVSFMNPKIDIEDFDGLLMIEFWEQIKLKDGSMDEDLSFAIDCTNYELLISSHESLSSDRMILELQPGESFTFSTKFPFRKCKPGLYVAEGIYKSFRVNDSDVKNLIVGEYHTNGIKLEVKPIVSHEKKGTL